METVNLVRRNWETLQDKLAGLQVRELNLADDVQRMIDVIRERSDSYEQNLMRRLEDLGARNASTPAVGHLEIARRASAGIAPYQSREKDGYRDTLIWLTLLAEAERSAGDFWFVSENTQDFGPKPPNWTGNNLGSRSDCPILFHSQLRKELAERELEERVKYVAGLQSLEQHLAALHAPIAGDELNQLISSIDFDRMNLELDRRARGSRVSPSQAALSPNSVDAVVHALLTDGADWAFSDAAHRGAGHWTTQFTVDAKLELLVLNSTGDSSVVTKTLRLSGYANFEEPSKLAALEVSDIESTPDDPDRALWERASVGSFSLPPGLLDSLRQTASFQMPPGTLEAFKAAGSFSLPPGLLDSLRQTPGTQMPENPEDPSETTGDGPDAPERTSGSRPDEDPK